MPPPRAVYELVVQSEHPPTRQLPRHDLCQGRSTTCTARTARGGLLLSLAGRRLTGRELLTPLGFHNKAESAVRLRTHPVLSSGLCAPVSLLDRLPRAPTCSSCFTSCHSAGVLGGKRGFLSEIRCFCVYTAWAGEVTLEMSVQVSYLGIPGVLLSRGCQMVIVYRVGGPRVHTKLSQQHTG